MPAGIYSLRRFALCAPGGSFLWQRAFPHISDFLAGKADFIRIAFFSKELPSDRPNGVSCQAHRLANGLAQRGHHVVCFSFSPRPSDALYEHRQYFFKGHNRLANKFIPARCFARQDIHEFDIVHYHGDDYLAKGSRRRVRTFYGSALHEARHARTISRFMYQALFYAFEIISCTRPGVKIGISKSTCASLPFVPYYIPCGVPLDRFRPGGAKTTHPSILFVGDLHSRKRGSLLLNIFAGHILPSHPSCLLSVVGPQPVNHSHVRYLGNIDEQALIEQYRQAWAYCLPSSYEGFGVPAIEAMACATAVVAVENAGTREIIRHEHNGLLASEHTLGSCLNRILSDETLRDRLCENGLQCAQDNFDIRAVAAQYERIYESMHSERNK